MSKIILTDLDIILPSNVAYNNNNATLETAFDNTLSRDGTTPNQMEANLDMNSFRILNLPAPAADSDPVRLVDVATGIQGPQGVTGPAGPGVISGTGVPADNVTGVDGDFYINKSTYFIYGPRTAGLWGTGTSLVGPLGAGSGDMLRANNLSDLTSASTARTNLSVSATGLDATYLTKADNFASVASITTARSNLGLTSAATTAIGTSGATIPLLSTANTWSGLQTLSAGADLVVAATPSDHAVGYLGTPLNSQASNYTLVMSDAGKNVFCFGGSTATLTIPSNASVAFPIGTTIKISTSGAQTNIAITSDTLSWLPSGASGTRALSAPGFAIIEKVTATTWWITGVNLT